MMKSPTNNTPWSGRLTNIASCVSPPCTGINSMRVPPTLSSVRRLMVTMQQVPGIDLRHRVNRIQQPLQVPFLYERRSQVRHDEISHEQHALVRQIDKHRVVRLSALHRDQLDACTTHLEFCATVDGDHAAGAGD